MSNQILIRLTLVRKWSTVKQFQEIWTQFWSHLIKLTLSKVLEFYQIKGETPWRILYEIARHSVRKPCTSDHELDETADLLIDNAVKEIIEIQYHNADTERKNFMSLKMNHCQIQSQWLKSRRWVQLTFYSYNVYISPIIEMFWCK